MSADSGTQIASSKTHETATWALSLPLFFLAYAFASVSELLAIEVTDRAYYLLFWVIIPLLLVSQAAISRSPKGAALRSATIVVLIALGLVDSRLWSEAGSATKVLAYTLAYLIVFCAVLVFTRILRAKTASSPVLLRVLCRSRLRSCRTLVCNQDTVSAHRTRLHRRHTRSQVQWAIRIRSMVCRTTQTVVRTPRLPLRCEAPGQ